MTRSTPRAVLSGLLGLLGVSAIAVLPLACQSGGVGDPCTPEDEYDPQFSGFKVTEENIESRSFQCETRICLVNHFQGRVSCPYGQQSPSDAGRACGGPGQTCAADEDCLLAGSFATDCEKDTDCANGNTCDKKGKFCSCVTGNCPAGQYCDSKTHTCSSYICHKKNNCQQANAEGDSNKGKDCCVPGTDRPVASEVCGQCEQRNAANAVYCSCRCGVAENEPDDPNFNFCECPDGFECSEIRKNVGLGDKQITGKYCIKKNTKFEGEIQCATVTGFTGSDACSGITK